MQNRLVKRDVVFASHWAYFLGFLKHVHREIQSVAITLTKIAKTRCIYKYILCRYYFFSRSYIQKQKLTLFPPKVLLLSGKTAEYNDPDAHSTSPVSSIKYAFTHGHRPWPRRYRVVAIPSSKETVFPNLSMPKCQENKIDKASIGNGPHILLQPDHHSGRYAAARDTESTSISTNNPSMHDLDTT